MAETKKTTTNEKPPRKDMYYLTADQIQVATFADGRKLNSRIDFGDIEEFAEEIYAHGKIEMPTHGFKKEGIHYLTDGERRFKAVLYINKKYNTNFVIPFLSESKDTTTADRLYKQRIINNSGKPFSPVEDANLINELLKEGQTEKQICAELKFTGVYISNLKLLHNSPQKIKDFIANGILSPTEAMRILRKEKDFDSAIATIEETLTYVKQTKGKSQQKITTKDVRNAEGKVNSFSAIKKAFKLAPKRVVRQDNIDLFNQLKKFVDGEITLEWLVEQLYEPETNEKPE